jgi:hypothetical protein
MAAHHRLRPALHHRVLGVLEIFASVRLRRAMSNEFGLIIGGVLSVLFGLVLIAAPGAGALAVVFLRHCFARADLASTDRPAPTVTPFGRMSPWAEAAADDGLGEHIRPHCVSRRCRAAQLDNALSLERMLRRGATGMIAYIPIRSGGWIPRPS